MSLCVRVDLIDQPLLIATAVDGRPELSEAAVWQMVLAALDQAGEGMSVRVMVWRPGVDTGELVLEGTRRHGPASRRGAGR